METGQQLTHEYHGLQAFTQYCVQVLGETKQGSGPEYYDGCVNVTTDEDGKNNQNKINKQKLYMLV